MIESVIKQCILLQHLSLGMHVKKLIQMKILSLETLEETVCSHKTEWCTLGPGLRDYVTRAEGTGFRHVIYFISLWLNEKANKNYQN